MWAVETRMRPMGTVTKAMGIPLTSAEGTLMRAVGTCDPGFPKLPGFQVAEMGPSASCNGGFIALPSDFSQTAN